MCREALTPPTPNPTTSGICYAATDDGRTLPVIDVTHPVFRLALSEAELSALSAQFVEESKRRERLPAFVQRLLLRSLLRRSRLGRGMLAASGSFLSGLSTYELKLGVDSLGGDAHPLDRRIAASFPALATRLRLQDVARLLADGLSPSLRATTGRPLVLLNIAGGPAADSLNALLLIRAENPAWLVDRRIDICVLDLDPHGPAFGARAAAALSAAGAPLAGLQIHWRHVAYNWRETGSLGRVLGELGANDAACGISSEGGLFEYGSDEEITSNLRALHVATSPDAIVVGSVTRDAEPARRAQAASRALTRLRTIEAFRGLAERAGWTVELALERPFSYNVRCVKA